MSETARWIGFGVGVMIAVGTVVKQSQNSNELED